jgi:Cu2+-exporting ATPase/Cu+-exporting ATPase
MTTRIVPIKGMHCASCATVITKKIAAVAHVHSVSVNYGTETAQIDFDETKVSLEDINQNLEKLGYSLVAPSDHGNAQHNQRFMKDRELADLKHKIEFLIPITISVVVLMMWDIFSQTIPWIPNLPIPMDLFNSISMILATVVLFWVGKPYLLGVARFIRYGIANMDTLIGIGTLTAYVYSTLITLFPVFTRILFIPSYQWWG